ncbi:unnamed protein product [Boreogadus saida]
MGSNPQPPRLENTGCVKNLVHRATSRGTRISRPERVLAGGPPAATQAIPPPLEQNAADLWLKDPPGPIRTSLRPAGSRTGDPVQDRRPCPGPETLSRTRDPVQDQRPSSGPETLFRTRDPLHDQRPRPGPETLFRTRDPLQDQRPSPGPETLSRTRDPLQDQDLIKTWWLQETAGVYSFFQTSLSPALLWWMLLTFYWDINCVLDLQTVPRRLQEPSDEDGVTMENITQEEVMEHSNTGPPRHRGRSGPRGGDEDVLLEGPEAPAPPRSSQSWDLRRVGRGMRSHPAIARRRAVISMRCSRRTGSRTRDPQPTGPG